MLAGVLHRALWLLWHSTGWECCSMYSEECPLYSISACVSVCVCIKNVYMYFRLFSFFLLGFLINLLHLSESTEIPPYLTNCPSNGLCSRLPPDCMTCNTNYSCIYGKTATFDCKVKPHVHCVVSNLLILTPDLSN